MQKYMSLDIMPVNGFNDFVQEYYSNHGTYHEGDAGLDLFCPEDMVIPPNSFSNKIRLGICCSAKYVKFKCQDTYKDKPNLIETSTGFHLYPRSSTGSKTGLRLSNSVGIIDQGYRGELMAVVDNHDCISFNVKKGDRLFQICAPDLKQIRFGIVDKLDKTTRGQSGFGSTNQ